MTEQNEVYLKPERKRELIKGLNEILNKQLNAAEKLDEKAFEILKVSSATFGLVSALEITLTAGTVGPNFWTILGAVLVLYLMQVVFVLLAIQPMVWFLVPGGADGKTNYKTLLKKYVYHDENRYLDQLIADYAGDVHSEKGELEGAIAKAQVNNLKKTAYIRTAAFLLSLIIVGLIIMAVVAVG